MYINLYRLKCKWNSGLQSLTKIECFQIGIMFDLLWMSLFIREFKAYTLYKIKRYNILSKPYKNTKKNSNKL